MELEGDNPAPRPQAAHEPMGTQALHVTPENVVVLAKTFQNCADRLGRQLAHRRPDLWVLKSWMQDPASEWARNRFNEYFVSSANSFVRIVQSEFEQHKAVSRALVATAQLYGLTEELIKAGFVDIEADR
jgi:hypothetical protein